MNYNIFNEIAGMTKQELETRLYSIFLNENESKMFEKCKEIVDQGFKMTRNDSVSKIIEATAVYYSIKYQENNKINN